MLTSYTIKNAYLHNSINSQLLNYYSELNLNIKNDYKKKYMQSFNINTKLNLIKYL